MNELSISKLLAQNIEPLPFDTPSSIRKVLTRCTIPLNQVPSNARITQLRKDFDIVAVRPVDEKSLSQACVTVDADLISLDCGIRYPFPFKFRTLGAALSRGIKFEITYGPGMLGANEARRNLIQNATALVRSTRGRGIIISSEAASALGCRAPHDIVNMAIIWGLKQDVAMESVTEGPRSLVAAAQLRKRSFKTAVDVIYVGESNTTEESNAANAKIKGSNLKRKASNTENDTAQSGPKREKKQNQKTPVMKKDAPNRGNNQTKSTGPKTAHGKSTPPTGNLRDTNGKYSKRARSKRSANPGLEDTEMSNG
jgi:ribonuclease P/MRP protein subunit RPP1